ncbi:BglG family transcription antiterminator [Staphylococcus saccharolyticus]|uniref:BglG family transcription antiterminator n=1 Tax=Staphylococcus saccharolyticus TaxID=33028 RepID=UPI00102D9C7F|nr:BglG family transcription antiterminator [Staphylococcus saccharolyticus]MBL7573852.1 BglG family transcription antiterminator [Staphylococcus saccharolyticus]MBL7584360.1 BglG family transcription antiterminator [Staphylococcus saccharolyticus]MBL7639223.1 BglG family transcription antiterminator [Staphylococcus saccharolyticus]QRJ68547.1 BglG family transcription antiterminator [Staphylococcus saccharolyticus]TAA91865.1 PTS mannose transporter subunit IIA [Staphylococcus saccharolyticus]
MIHRQIKLIQLLLNNVETYLNGQEVATFLNVSNRTVRNDIKTINSTFLEDLIISTQSKGYQLNTNIYATKEIESLLEERMSRENKLLITIAYKLFMEHHTYTLHELESLYHLSKTEVMDCLTRIQNWATKFDVAVSLKKKQGIIIDATTTNINNAVLHLNQLSNYDFKVEDLIVQELPKAHTQKMRQIINQNLQHFGLQASDNKVQQLLVHLILLIKRTQPDCLDWKADVESLAIAKKCIQDINHSLRYQLNNETSELFSFFISYHFNKFDLGVQQLFIQSYIDHLIQLMDEKISFAFSRDAILKHNMNVHFSRTYLRIMRNVYLNNPLTAQIKKLYPFIFNTLYEAIHQLSQDTDIQLSEDEIAFLTIHFQSSIERTKPTQINVIIACYYGLGVSTLLAEKIKKLNNAISIVDTLKLEELQSYDFKSIDLLITTHDFNVSNISNLPKVIQVSPLFSDDDAKHIESFLKVIQNPMSHKDDLSPIQFSIESDFKLKNLTDILSIFNRTEEILQQHHATLKGYIESAMERERQSSTFIGNGIAIPHGNPEKVLKSHVIIFKAPQPIPWKQHNVKLVFFLAIAKKDSLINRKMIQAIAQLEEDDINELCLLEDTQLKHTLIKRFRE